MAFTASISILSNRARLVPPGTFAREALLRALETGNNRIFLSASHAQAFQFKRFIQKLAREIGVELRAEMQLS